MLIYSNNREMPHNFNIYHDKGDKYPWTLETINDTKLFENVPTMFDYLRAEGQLNNAITAAVMNHVKKEAEKNVDSLEWKELDTSEKSLSEVLSDSAILHAEPIDYPATDGISFYIIDRNEKPRILEICVADSYLYGFDSNDLPITVRLSSVIGE